ncbi:MAG: hypothetical protein PUB46_07850 [Lachnospiraceae bacterium]|uniref:hypothetical protein n=1 Tax=Roseburia hominis TaxID=301301 RepID=UPI001F1CF63F|nr:hypothetical protein [Roseburia hominis]MCI5713447.1 hypothetical protein [Lachnospiraceae bacterium]MDD6169977.1 hypothetical protein [Lachnospiraceae bacterium]MDY4840350.1 hypothetical protein [Lachnospiraceae bacterium]
MEKNARLANIYIKIYNKQTLTMDDIAFLAKYDPECFTKTCQNLVYDMPETKELMTQEPEEIIMEEEEPVKKDVISQEEHINLLLQNLRNMKLEEVQAKNLDPVRVQNLLGSLYMEMLFPHNDKDKYFEMKTSEDSKFNKKV